MIKSMTGFGRGEYEDGKRRIVTEIKSVNHRYADISIRMPKRYSFAEERVKSVVKSTVKRGKTDVSILVEYITENDVSIRLNEPAAKQYYENLMALKEKFSLSGGVSIDLMASLPDVLKAIPDASDEEEVCRALEESASRAVISLDGMRTAEGGMLAEDILLRGENIKGLISKIEALAPEVIAAYCVKLKERIKELTENSVVIPEERLAVEAAIFADKSSITEELVRLGSHITQMAGALTGDNLSDGRKLDFLVQEMHREANTIGSKANNIEITNLMLEIKGEIEKIREQVQNIQ